MVIPISINFKLINLKRDAPSTASREVPVVFISNCAMYLAILFKLIDLLFCSNNNGFVYFFFCSLKLECEKLASEKIEIQRHYVMVSEEGC